MPDESTETARSPAPRGRPPRVTEERLRAALLDIRGEVPTMGRLADQLGVGIATLYTHVRGQDELQRLAGEVAFDAWELPVAEPGAHWAVWALAYARDARELAAIYPAVAGARALAGGQLRYVERVLAQLVALGLSDEEALSTFHAIALLVLGVGAQLHAMRQEEVRAGQTGWQILHEAIGEQRDQLPLLGRLAPAALPDLDAAFDDLVWFTLSGLARERGEILPVRPRVTG